MPCLETESVSRGRVAKQSWGSAHRNHSTVRFTPTRTVLWLQRASSTQPRRYCGDGSFVPRRQAWEVCSCRGGQSGRPSKGSAEVQAFPSSLICCKHTLPRNLSTGSHSSAIPSLQVDGPAAAGHGLATLLALPALLLTSDLTARAHGPAPPFGGSLGKCWPAPPPSLHCSGGLSWGLEPALALLSLSRVTVLCWEALYEQRLWKVPPMITLGLKHMF